jgi:hypothetical protein
VKLCGAQLRLFTANDNTRHKTIHAHLPDTADALLGNFLNNELDEVLPPITLQLIAAQGIAMNCFLLSNGIRRNYSK